MKFIIKRHHWTSSLASLTRMLLAALFIVISSSSYAQQPDDVNDTSSVNPVSNENDNTSNATIIPNFRNTPLLELIDLVSEITGKAFILDPRVRHGQITFIAAQPMPYTEFYASFQQLLRMHGYATITQDNSVMIIPEVNMRQRPSKESMVGGAQPVTVTIKVHHVPAPQLVPILRPLLPQYAHLAAYPSSNMLIVSDYSDNVERITQLVRELDQASESAIVCATVKTSDSSIMFERLASLTEEGSLNQQFQLETHGDYIQIRASISACSSIRSNLAEISQNPISESTTSQGNQINVEHRDLPQTSSETIKLLGVITADQPTLQRALVQIGNSSVRAVDLSEKIVDDFILHSVHANYVVLDNAGTLEVLHLLKGADSRSANQAQLNSTLTNSALSDSTLATDNSIPLGKQLAVARKTYLASNGKPNDFVRYRPQSIEGNIVGYRIYPGKYRSLFLAAGLNTGDVVKSINGITASDSAFQTKVLNQLRTVDSFTLVIQRRGQDKTIKMSIQ